MSGEHPTRRRAATGAAVAIIAAVAAPSAFLRPDAFDPKTAPFALAYHDIVSAYREAAALVVPGERLSIEAVEGPDGEYTLKTESGIVEPLGVRKWRWTAPDRPGAYALTFEGPGATHDAVRLHAFVLVPLSEEKGGFLRGYRIGDYPPPLKGNPIYRAPRGLVEVTRENAATKISPHFELKQFVCKEDASAAFPKYLTIDERLPLKLEAILERVNGLGVLVDTLHVMSAYRTPYYNRAIGDVKYSMHQFGSAADIFVDPGNRDRMADLNHDGRIDVNDAKFLYDRIEDMLAHPPFARLQGGMGFYPATGAHPPFVHVDVRGAKARWRG